MKRSGFKRKEYNPMKRTSFKQKDSLFLHKRSKLRVAHHSETNDIKQEIQNTVREIVIIRDGGCILRHYPETGKCGGYRKDGGLILQGEHLETRSNSASYADTRLIVCLCRHHHGHYKPQYSDDYYKIVRQHIGPERSALLTRIQEDRSAHKMDWKIELLALKQELGELQKSKKLQINY